MSFSFILVTRFKISTETENAESAAYLFSLFYKTKKKTKKKCFVDCFVLGVNQDIQIKGLLMYFFLSI